MSLEQFEKQMVENSLTKINAQGEKVTFKQQVSMTGRVDNGTLIKVTSGRDNATILCVEKEDDKHFLKVLSFNLKNEFGQTLSLPNDRVEILPDSLSAPIKFGSGLDNELIVTISLGGGKVGKAKITPTKIDIEYNGLTYSSSSEQMGYCYNMDISATAVENLFNQNDGDSSLYQTPTIFGKGEKCPLYLLGMYASQIPENKVVQMGDIRIFKAQATKDCEPVVFFGQKDKLFLYNKGKLERTTSYHFTCDKDGEVSLAIERVGDTAYLKLPTGIKSKSFPTSTAGKTKVLKLFKGFSLPNIQRLHEGKTFNIPQEITPIQEDPRKWAKYSFNYRPTIEVHQDNKGLREIPFQVVEFENNNNVYYINPTLQKIFMIDNGKFAWQNYSDFADTLANNEFKNINIEITIQNINNQTIILNKTNQTAQLLSNGNIVSDISEQAYEDITSIPLSPVEEDFIEVTPSSEETFASEEIVNPLSNKDSESEVQDEQPSQADTQGFADVFTNINEEEVDDEFLLQDDNREYVINFNTREIIDNSKPNDKIDFNNFVYSHKDNKEFITAIDNWNAQKFDSQKIDTNKIIETCEKQNKSKSQAPKITPQEKPASATNKSVNPEEKAEAKKETKKEAPKKTKKDLKNKAETFSSIFLGLGLLATLCGAIFMPLMVAVALPVTLISGATYTFSDMFKYELYSKCKDKIKKAERSEKEAEKFLEREKEFDRYMEKGKTRKANKLLNKQREFLTKGGSKDGMYNILTLSKMIKDDNAKVQFFNKYSDVITYELSCQPDIKAYTKSLLENVGEKKDDVVLALSNSQQKLMSYDKNMSKIALQHIETQRKLENLGFLSSILASQQNSSPTKVSEILKEYTHAMYQEEFTNTEVSLYGQMDNIDENTLSGEELEIHNAIKQALISKDLEKSFASLSNSMQKFGIEQKIQDYANTGMIESLLPHENDKDFNPDKSIIGVARKLAQAEAGANIDARQVLSDCKNISKVIAQESSNDISNLLNISTLVNTNLNNSKLSQAQINKTIKEISLSPLAKQSLSQNQIEVIARAKVIAQKQVGMLQTQHDKTTSLVQEHFKGEQASFYNQILYFIDASINNRITNVKISNSFDNAMFEKTDAEIQKNERSIKEICGGSDQERAFSGKFNSFIATLSPETQKEIWAQLPLNNNSTIQEKKDALIKIAGKEKVEISQANTITYEEFARKFTSVNAKKGTSFDKDEADAYIVDLKNESREQTKVQFSLIQEGLHNAQANIKEGTLKQDFNERCDEILGKTEIYSDVKEWIASTQNIDAEKVEHAYKQIMQINDTLSDKKLAESLLEYLNIKNPATIKAYKKAVKQNQIKCSARKRTQKVNSTSLQQLRLNLNAVGNVLAKEQTSMPRQTQYDFDEHVFDNILTNENEETLGLEL